MSYNQLSQKLCAVERDKQIIVTNGYWEVIHDLNRGGCISSIRIFNGSNKNILMAPIASYFSKYSESALLYPDFRDDLDKNAKAKILKKSKNYIELQIKAQLTDRKLGELGVEVETIYEYRMAYIKIHRTFRCKNRLQDINVIGIGCIETIPEFDYWCAKGSARAIENERAQVYTSLTGSLGVEWGKVQQSTYPSYVEWHPSSYLCAFNRGVEGLETFINSNLKEWERQIVPDGNTCARFGIYRRFEPMRTVIICEPLFCLWTKPPELSGEYKFTSYIGIPNKSEYGVKKKYMWLHTVLRWRKENRWATEEEIKELAANGVQVIVHHHDSPNGYGLWPHGSFFWADGKYPPYQKEELVNLKRTINLVHKYGMKIIPYFNPFELHPDAQVYKENIKEWAKLLGNNEKLLFNHTVGGVFGVAVCMASGFADFLKSYIKKIITEYGFDGAFFDGVSITYCNNLKHSNWGHTTVDGMIELVEYARNLVGPDGIVITHQTQSPWIAIENLIDICVMMEDTNGYPSFQKGVPPLDCFPVYCDFVNVAHKAVCAYSALLEHVDDYAEGDIKKVYYDSSEEDIKKMVVRCMVKGLSIKGGIDPNKEYVYWKKMSRHLKGRDLSKYRFEDYRSGFVIIDNPNIKGAVYRSQKEIIVVLGNTESPKEEKFSWKIDFDKCDWKIGNKIHLIRDGHQIVVSSNERISEMLQGYDYKIIYIKP